jgi:hypothetical protein
VADDLRQRIADVLDDLDYGHDQQERRYVFVDDVLEAVMAVRDERLEVLRAAYDIVRGHLKATRKDYSERTGEMLEWRERAEQAGAALALARERLDALIAAGFGATTDTLRALRAALDDSKDDRA